MVQCKTVLLAIGFVFLLFLGIPIRIKSPIDTHNETIQLFEDYIHEYNKTYQHNHRLRVHKYKAFQSALKEINKLNSQRKHNTSARFGITRFSDLSKEEFMKTYLQDDMYSRIQNNTVLKIGLYSEASLDSNESNNNKIKRSLNTLPPKVDWRKKNAVTKINNQKNCGACWAFSTIETIESMQAIKRNVLERLSVQEFIDCAGYNNDGCNGGDICTLVYWLYDNEIHIRKELEYPLHLKTESCKLNPTLPGLQISYFSCNSYVDHEEALLNLIAYHGPVAVAINAILWQNYLGGIIHFHCNSSPSLLNHAVQIVGYDLEAEIPFYIVRNSWGHDFGDNGYLYIAIGNNMCGLAHEVVSVDVV